MQHCSRLLGCTDRLGVLLRRSHGGQGELKLAGGVKLWRRTILPEMASRLNSCACRCCGRGWSSRGRSWRSGGASAGVFRGCGVAGLLDRGGVELCAAEQSGQRSRV